MIRTKLNRLCKIQIHQDHKNDSGQVNHMWTIFQTHLIFLNHLAVDGSAKHFGFNYILSFNFYFANVWKESQSELKKNFCEGSKKVDHRNHHWLNLISPVKRTIYGFLNSSFFLRFQTFNSLWYKFWYFSKKKKVVSFVLNVILRPSHENDAP